MVLSGAFSAQQSRMSVAFKSERAQKTSETQSRLAAGINGNPAWVWPRKTVVQWTADVTALDQLKSAEVLKRTEWRNKAEAWDANLAQIQRITRDIRREGLVHFRNDPVKLQSFDGLRTDARNRDDTYNQGDAARAAWQVADANWTFSPDIDLEDFAALLTASIACRTVYNTAESAWRAASSALNFKADAVDQDSVDWYAAATRKFAAGTPEGDLIRSNVPTTSRPEEPVGPVVISNAMSSANGDIHFDANAPGATRYTYLQQAPGAPAFVVVLADSPNSSFTIHAQAAGVHKFKVVPSNSRGEGPESAVVEVTVAFARAA
jgi:hypothetical protein